MSGSEISELDEALLRTRAEIRDAGLMKAVAVEIGLAFGWRRAGDEADTVTSWAKRVSAMLGGLHHRQWTLKHHLVAVRVLRCDPARVAEFAVEKRAA